MVWEHTEVGEQEWKVGHDFKKYTEYIYEFLIITSSLELCTYFRQ